MGIRDCEKETLIAGVMDHPRAWRTITIISLRILVSSPRVRRIPTEYVSVRVLNDRNGG
jgi:hypothetical protein